MVSTEGDDSLDAAAPKSKPPVHPSGAGGFAEKKGLLKQRNKDVKMTFYL